MPVVHPVNRNAAKCQPHTLDPPPAPQARRNFSLTSMAFPAGAVVPADSRQGMLRSTNDDAGLAEARGSLAGATYLSISPILPAGQRQKEAGSEPKRKA